MSLIIMQKLANGCFWSQISRSRESVKSMERSHRLEKAIDRWCNDILEGEMMGRVNLGGDHT